jgi:hypothetical protein
MAGLADDVRSRAKRPFSRDPNFSYVPVAPLALPEDGLDVVAVWIQNERREVAKGIVPEQSPGPPLSWPPEEIAAAVKVLDLAAAAQRYSAAAAGWAIDIWTSVSENVGALPRSA